jgi:hypothetical protein
MRKLRRWLAVILLLYLIAWVGGWITHALTWQAQLQATWRSNKRYHEKKEELARQWGSEEYLQIVKEDRAARLWPDGPIASVDWCLPLLPGVLLSSTHAEVGPLAGGGNVQG